MSGWKDALRGGVAIAVGIAAVQFLLHVFTNGNYGIFRDELYYLDCARHLDWGYVDQPPLSIWLLTVWKAVFGDSIHSLRILPALCGSGLIVLTGALAAEMGGRRWAQLFAALAVAVGAAGLVLCGFYSRTRPNHIHQRPSPKTSSCMTM